MKTLPILALLAMLALVIPVSADISLTNTTARDVTDIAYPEVLFYTIFIMGAIFLLVNIYFIFQQTVPASPMAVSGVIGFLAFLVSAYMAPLTAKSVWIVSGSEAQFVSSYIFSPWVSYLCLGLATINLLFFGYGVLRYFQLLAENHRRINNPDYQFDMYLRGDDW